MKKVYTAPMSEKVQLDPKMDIMGSEQVSFGGSANQGQGTDAPARGYGVKYL